MCPKERMHSLPPDILSGLPDLAIDVILMCLPCKEAVRTSILSKKWRYRWCRLTEFTLDVSHQSVEEDLRGHIVKFSEIIYPLVTLYTGPITKFTLDISQLRSYPNIDFFIYFLSRKDIKHLVVYLPNYAYCELPSSLFTCSQLRHLDLNYCVIDPPSFFKGFDKLISLELFTVVISSKVLRRLISHCPLLEQLVLINIENATTFKINAPMLRSFKHTGTIHGIRLRNVPRLVNVSLTGFDMLPKYLDFAKIFKYCSALEHLIIDFYNFELIAEDGYEVPTRLPFYLNSVKRFDMLSISLMESSHELSYVFCLMRSFPYLEYLEIEVYSEEDDGSIRESLELEHFSNVTFNHVREVKLKCYSGSMREMQLIKLLLAKSPVLVRLWIDRRREVLKTRLSLFNEVPNYWRASPKAEVVYID